MEKDLKVNVMEMIEDKTYDIVDEFAIEKTPVKQWDLNGLKARNKQVFNFNPDLETAANESNGPEELSEKLFDQVKNLYNQRESSIGVDITREI